MDAASTTLKNGNTMLTGPVGPIFFRYAAPWALGQLILSSAGLVDGIFIGRYAGSVPLAALNIIFPVFSFYFGVGIMVAAGGAVRCAKYMAEGKAEQASAMFSKSMAALVLFSLALSAGALLWSEPLVRFLGAEGELVEPCLAYLRTIMCFGPFLPCSYALSYFVRADQRPGLASAGLMLSAGLNIILDYLFIAVWGRGVSGAAAATGIAYMAPFFLLGSHFLTGRAGLRLTRRWGAWQEIFAASWNGSSELINELSVGVVMFLTNRIMMERLGASGVAAFAVVNYASWFGLTLAYGISDSLAPLVSANYGARRPERIRAFLRLALGVLLALGAIMFGLFTSAPGLLLALFLPGGGEVSSVTAAFLDIFKWAFWFNGLNMGLTSFFTGLHCAAQSAALSVLRSLVLPVLFLQLLPAVWGNTGVYAAIPCAEAVTFGVGMLLLRPACRNRMDVSMSFHNSL